VRRTTLLLGCVVATALSAPASAVASPLFASTFTMDYGTRAPGTASGFDTHMTWTDPGEKAAKPREVNRIVFHFAPGSRFDTNALPRCRASLAQVRDRGAAACPRGSRVATGSTMVNTGTSPIFGTKVTFFNTATGLIVFVQSGTLTITVFRDTVRGSTVTAHLKIPGGFALTDLHVTFPAHTARRLGRRRTYFRTPATCPASGVWTSSATFGYTDGSANELSATTPCTSG
jgi:hypothetical protein